MRRSIVSASLFLCVAFLGVTSTEAQTYQPQPYQQAVQGSPAPTYASSLGHGRGVGLGAVTMLNGTSGALFTWGSAGGVFHVDGLFGLRYWRDGDYTTELAFAGRFWYHLHAASFADFSVGGGLGLVSWTANPGTDNSDAKLDVVLQAGAQIRAFIVPNVALIADLGLGLYFGDSNNILFGGQGTGGGAGRARDFLSGSLGIAYFFE